MFPDTAGMWPAALKELLKQEILPEELLRWKFPSKTLKVEAALPPQESRGRRRQRRRRRVGCARDRVGQRATLLAQPAQRSL